MKPDFKKQQNNQGGNQQQGKHFQHQGGNRDGGDKGGFRGGKGGKPFNNGGNWKDNKGGNGGNWKNKGGDQGGKPHFGGGKPFNKGGKPFNKGGKPFNKNWMMNIYLKILTALLFECSLWVTSEYWNSCNNKQSIRHDMFRES